MLQEAMEVFQQILQQKGDRLVLDEYVPKDGTYRIIKLTEDSYNIEKTLDIRYDRKNDEIIGKTDSIYNKICYLDYYSKLLEMNKPIDAKKIIHSNNYLSLWMKKDSVKEEKLTEEIIDSYYELLKYPEIKYGKKLKAKVLYEATEQELGKPNVTLIEKIRKCVAEKDIWEDIDLERKDYLKFFFIVEDWEETQALYRCEGSRYLFPNIFNNNDFNEVESGEILGLPNDNMGMNAKKPYLANRTRKVAVPYLLDKNQAILQAKLFDYLMGFASKGKVNVYIDADHLRIRGYSNTEEPQGLENGYFLRLKKGKEVEIHQGDIISNYNTNLQPVFYLRNGIGIPDKTLEKYDIQYNTSHDKLWMLKGLIDQTFFENKLSNNFFTEAKDIAITDGVLKRTLLESRDRLFAWFYKGCRENVEELLDKISMDLIINAIGNGRVFLARRQFNLRWSLIDYFSKDRGMELRMENVRKILWEKMNLKDDWEFMSGDEFGYAAGQMVSYLISKSKANNKPSSLVNPYLNAKNHTVIKRRLLQLYKKYNYDISLYPDNRAEKIFTHIMDYMPKENESLNKEMIAAGFTAELLIYNKKNQEGGEEL